MNIYNIFVMQKADALLMDEQSMDFFEQQLQVSPKLAKYACAYVRAMLNKFKATASAQNKKKLKQMAY